MSHLATGPTSNAASAPAAAPTPAPFPYPSIWSDSDEMGYLFASLPSSRADDPAGYDTKVAFWKDMIIQYAQHRASTSLTFSFDDLRHVFTREGDVPAPLQHVACMMLSNSNLCRADHYPPTKSKGVFSYLVSFMSPSKIPHSLPPGFYVIPSVISSHASQFYHHIITQCHEATDYIIPENVISTLSPHPYFPSDLQILLRHLISEGRCVECTPPDGDTTIPSSSPSTSPRIYRFIAHPSSTSSPTSTSTSALDYAAGQTKWMRATLQQRLQQREVALEKTCLVIRAHLRQGQKPLAIKLIPHKKRLETSINALHTQILNLDTILMTINNTHTQQQMASCLTQVRDAFQSYHAKSCITADTVAELHDDIASHIDEIDEIDESMSHVSIDTHVDETTLSAEYDQLMAELETDQNQKIEQKAKTTTTTTPATVTPAPVSVSIPSTSSSSSPSRDDLKTAVTS